MAMLFDVVEGLLHDAKEIQFRGWRTTLGKSCEAGFHHQLRPRLELPAEVAASIRQSQRVQVGGAEVVGDAAVFIQRLDEQFVAAREELAGLGFGAT